MLARLGWQVSQDGRYLIRSSRFPGQSDTRYPIDQTMEQHVRQHGLPSGVTLAYALQGVSKLVLHRRDSEEFCT